MEPLYFKKKHEHYVMRVYEFGWLMERALVMAIAEAEKWTGRA